MDNYVREEFTSLFDEVKTDEPRPAWAEDHRGLLCKEVVDNLFEDRGGNDVELGESVIVRVSLEGTVG